MAKMRASEIDKLLAEGVIDEVTAERMRDRAAQTKTKKTAIITTFFGILGALLIGLGFILMFAKNWALMPVPMKTLVALLPLLASQLLMIFVIQNKQHSAAWREGVAVLMCAGVFSAVALVDQIYHISVETETFLTTCALLILPAIYILNSAAAVPVYLGAILWAGNSNLATAGLLALPLLFIARVIWQDKSGGKSHFLQYCSFFAMLLFILGYVGYSQDKSVVLIAYLLGALAIDSLFSADENISDRPFSVLSGLGLLVTFFVYSFDSSWYGGYGFASLGWVSAPICISAILIAIYALIKDCSVATRLLLIGGAYALISTVFGVFGVVSVAVFNLLILIYAGLLIYDGVQKNLYTRANMGMVLAIILTLIRFTDMYMDITVRGFAFIIIGAAVLAVNVKISRGRKS